MRARKEQRQLARLHRESALPTSFAAYKDNLNYCLERHLLKFEAILPKSELCCVVPEFTRFYVYLFSFSFKCGYLDEQMHKTLCLLVSPTTCTERYLTLQAQRWVTVGESRSMPAVRCVRCTLPSSGTCRAGLCARVRRHSKKVSSFLLTTGQLVHFVLVAVLLSCYGFAGLTDIQCPVEARKKM